MRIGRLINWLESLLAWLVLGLLLLFTYARFFQVPYAGLYFSPSGQVAELYVSPPPPAALQLGDQLIQVGPVAWADFMRDLRQSLYQGVKPGQVVPTLIERKGARLTIPWVFPGPTSNEIWARLISEWPLAFVFWLAGLATLLFVRPRDGLRRLLMAFDFTTAVWLIAGSTTSRWHVWEGALVLRSAVWLAAPVYLQLHWTFPQPLRRMPAWVWWGAYLLAAVMAGLEWLQVPPSNFYLLGFSLALVGSLVLLVAHTLWQPAQRRDIARLVALWLVALIPPLVLGILGTIAQVPTFGGGALVGLPALPLAYLFVAFRRRLGLHEVRANRLLAVYLFLVVWLSLLAVIVPLLNSLLPAETLLVDFTNAILSVLVAVLVFPRFQRFVNRRLLGITWSADQILAAYARRIILCPNTPVLAQLLTGELLPSLLVRQSALYRVQAGQLSPIFQMGLPADQQPADGDLPALLQQTARYRAAADPTSRPCPWARLILPLRLPEGLIGLWLFGRRDPDDEYGQVEIAILQAVADQTAIALTNIVYAERLRALYENAIDQREVERVSLSRELHDHTLQQLFVLKANAGELLDRPPFADAFEAVTHGLTQTIRGLRPPMLEYGLYRAIVALVDDWANRPDTPADLVVACGLPESDARYPYATEVHLYRIIQQAGENALQHAHARRLAVTGRLAADSVDLMVEDDGLGLDPAKIANLAGLEAQGHFGLAGMQERAALIGALIEFDAPAQRGSCVHVRWQTKPD